MKSCNLVRLAAFVLGLVVFCSQIAEARKMPYQTAVLVGNLSGFDGYAPTFTSISALDEYYNRADSGDCDDACLSRAWRALVGESRAYMLPVGYRVWALRVEPDPADPDYRLCRIQVIELGSTNDDWVLCFVLRDQPS